MTDLRALPAFSTAAWQMSYGERAALEGLLSQLKPELAIEIGRAEGGSLRRIAAHSREVISFDLVDPLPELAELTNVTTKVGDSHQQLGETLAELAAAGRNVDFVLVDGDHSAEGARSDVADLLASPAVSRTVIVAHDSLNEQVRRGLEAVDYAAVDKVAYVDLDFVPGFVAQVESSRGHCWGGLGLVVVDEHRWLPQGVHNSTPFRMPTVAWPWAEGFRLGQHYAAGG